MRTRLLALFTLLLVLALVMAGCKPTADPQPAAPEPVENEEPAANEEPPTEPEPKAPEEESAAEESPINLIEFSTDDGVFHINYPEGWATNQVPSENGLAFGIVPTVADLSAGPALFERPAIMVYGSVRQISPELASPEQVEQFHVRNFYDPSSAFEYVIVGQPQVTQPSPYITYYFTQATATLSNGVMTNWMLGTALADQTVVLFAIGLPVNAMDQYGELAMQMFNSVEVDTLVTAELAE